MRCSPVFGGICSIVGLYLSWAFNLPTGGMIVLSMVAAHEPLALKNIAASSLQEAPCLSFKNQREHCVIKTFNLTLPV